MWRGLRECEGRIAEDNATTETLFVDYGEGRMTFVGTFIYDNEPFMMQALKTKPGVEGDRAHPTPNTEWPKPRRGGLYDWK